MLQIAPEDETPTDTEEKTDDALYCARCGHLVTRTRWKIAVGNGGGGRIFTNPMGITFHVVCFAEAPGVTAEGDPTDEHTWFPGYLWNFALCRGCGAHLGWHFRQDSGKGGADNFFGLIKDRLTSHPA